MSANRAPGKRHLLRWALSLAIVIVVFVVVLPRMADMSAVWETLVDMTWLEVLTLILAAAWNLVTYWLLLMAALPGLSLTRAMIVTEASTAVASILPGGGQAVGMGIAYRMYASWGFRRPAIALALVVSGVGDLFAKLGMPILALFFLTYYGDADTTLKVASLIGVALLIGAVVAFLSLLRSEASARKVGRGLGTFVSFAGRALGRPAVTGWDDALARFRVETVELLRARWPAVLGSSLLSHLSLYFVLLLSLRHIGVSENEVGWAEVLGAFAFVRLLSALQITPGGLGIVELGLSASLVLAGGDEAKVVAAVLVYRALTYLVQIPFGALTYLYWQHTQGRHDPPVHEPTAERVSGIPGS
jgi:putative heme transporter